MSRYRPPAPRASPYITEQGCRALREELEQLWGTRREVVVRLSAAAAEGDRSENAEYIYRKKQLRELDRRIGYLQRRIPKLSVVKAAPPRTDKVFFGATVAVVDESEARASYRIVGSDELDPGRNWISVDSPVARALLGRELDDEVQVHTPAGRVTWFIVGISY
jgi:transcription elongation factor GreB